MHPVRNGSFHHFSFLFFFPFFPLLSKERNRPGKFRGVTFLFSSIHGRRTKIGSTEGPPREKRECCTCNATREMPTNREGMEGGMNFMGCLHAGRRRKKKREGRASFCPSEWKYWHGNRRRRRMKKRRDILQTMNGLPPLLSQSEILYRASPSPPPSAAGFVSISINKPLLFVQSVSCPSSQSIQPIGSRGSLRFGVTLPAGR